MDPQKENLIFFFICAQDLPDIFVTFWDSAAHVKKKFGMHLKMCSFSNSLNSVR